MSGENKYNIFIKNALDISIYICYIIRKEECNMELEFYTVKEVSRILGLAEVTVRIWIQHEKIKSIKIGSLRRIPKSEIERLMEGE